jgi:ubiquinone/menaquinone biosynthesis C-methylase UbiE
MPKQGEIDYLKNIGEEGARHALDKPFSDPECAKYLVDLGVLMHALPPPPAKLLDLGCGSGWTSVFFARRGYDVTGQDIASDMIELARANAARHRLDNLRFVVSDYEEMAFRGEFDCAVFYDSLHHSVDERSAVAAAYRALKPGGVLMAIEPGEGHAQSPGAIEATRKYNVTERDMPPRLIIRAAQAAGFSAHEIIPNPWFLHVLSYGSAQFPRLSRLLEWKILRALALAASVFYTPSTIGAPVILRK